VDSLYLLIPIALVIVAVAVRILFWAIDSGQYQDLDREAWRILEDEDPEAPGGEVADRQSGTPGEGGPCRK